MKISLQNLQMFILPFSLLWSPASNFKSLVWDSAAASPVLLFAYSLLIPTKKQHILYYHTHHSFTTDTEDHWAVITLEKYFLSMKNIDWNGFALSVSCRATPSFTALAGNINKWIVLHSYSLPAFKSEICHHKQDHSYQKKIKYLATPIPHKYLTTKALNKAWRTQERSANHEFHWQGQGSLTPCTGYLYQ